MATSTAPSPGRTWLRRGIISALVLGAVALFVAAGMAADTDSPENAAISGGVVDSLTPDENSAVVQQSKVAVDLASGWTGELSINGTPIPEEQLLRNAALNAIEFTPGEDKIIEQLQAGQNCANADVWPIAEGPDGASRRNVVWCWDVV